MLEDLGVDEWMYNPYIILCDSYKLAIFSELLGSFWSSSTIAAPANVAVAVAAVAAAAAGISSGNKEIPWKSWALIETSLGSLSSYSDFVLSLSLSPFF